MYLIRQIIAGIFILNTKNNIQPTAYFTVDIFLKSVSFHYAEPKYQHFDNLYFLN